MKKKEAEEIYNDPPFLLKFRFIAFFKIYFLFIYFRVIFCFRIERLNLNRYFQFSLDKRDKVDYNHYCVKLKWQHSSGG